MEKLPENKYKVHVYDWMGTITIVNGREIMKRFEKPGKLPPTPKFLVPY